MHNSIALIAALSVISFPAVAASPALAYETSQTRATTQMRTHVKEISVAERAAIQHQPIPTTFPSRERSQRSEKVHTPTPSTSAKVAVKPAATVAPAPKSTPSPSKKPSPSPTPTTATPRPVQATAPQPAQTEPAQAPTPNTALSFASQVEGFLLVEINNARASYALAPLVRAPLLDAAARAHSSDMLLSGYFSHTAPNGCDAGCRLRAVGYGYSSYGENIYWMSGYVLTPAEAAQRIARAWMESSGHRANILGDFTHIGIGIFSQGDTHYATNVYAKPL